MSFKKNVFCPYQDFCKDDCFGAEPCDSNKAAAKMIDNVKKLEEENESLKRENASLKRNKYKI